MKNRFLLISLFLAFSFVSLRAQNAEETDLDLKYAVDMLKPGTQAPDFTLDDIDGNPVRLSDFRGRKVALQFWASWCPDCRAEIPQIKEMHASADPSEIVFVAVSFDRSREAFTDYVTGNSLVGVQLFDPAGMRESEIAKAYHVGWIPSLYLIDEDGNVLLATVMADRLAEAIAR